MESLKVSDYMNKHPVKFSEDMSVAEAVEKLLDNHQTGGPVVDSKNQLVGFLSEQDCLGQMVESSYYREQVALVKNVMQKEAISIKPYSSVIELAQMMLREKPKIYPVVDDDGRLLRSISRANVLQAVDIQLRDGYKNQAF